MLPRQSRREPAHDDLDDELARALAAEFDGRDRNHFVTASQNPRLIGLMMRKAGLVDDGEVGREPPAS